MKSLHDTTVTCRLSIVLLLAACLPVSVSDATQLTGRLALFGSLGRADPGDFGYIGGSDRLLGADQQSLRLMLDDALGQSEWSVHLKVRRQHQYKLPVGQNGTSQLFRVKEVSSDWLDHRDEDSATLVGYQLDRALYKRSFGAFSMSLGRQPIDWGSGRFWQPLNVFGAFAPTELDTDFKPGIDAAVFDWYPSPFSSLTAAYVLGANSFYENTSELSDPVTINDSGVILYKRQAGSSSEMSLLIGRVVGNDQIGAAFESEWSGMGWR
ncbi:MAG: hypothetical protein HKN85_01955, partial [Gammaproteobacteria bacterium]|nr:hypothetical protein [Gammaproteobacteria bacterium]